MDNWCRTNILRSDINYGTFVPVLSRGRCAHLEGKIWAWHWFRIKISGAPLIPSLMDPCSHHFTQSSTYQRAKMLRPNPLKSFLKILQSHRVFVIFTLSTHLSFLFLKSKLDQFEVRMLSVWERIQKVCTILLQRFDQWASSMKFTFAE